MKKPTEYQRWWMGKIKWRVRLVLLDEPCLYYKAGPIVVRWSSFEVAKKEGWIKFAGFIQKGRRVHSFYKLTPAGRKALEE